MSLISRKRSRSPFPETCPITIPSRISSKICEFLVPPFNADLALSKRICAQLRTKRYNLEEGIQLVQQLGGNGGDKFIYSSLIQLDAPFECKALMFTLITSKPNLADAFTYASFIKTTGNCKDLETAKEAFEKAKRLGLADACTYNSFIKAAGDLRDLQAAKEAFEKAQQLGLANAFTYTSFIQAAGDLGDLQAAKNAFQKAQQLHIADAFTYNSFIKAAGDLGDLQAAKNAFQKAQQLGLANTFTYNSFIKAAGDLGDLQAAKEAFEKAKQLGFADAVTYNSFIKAAGDLGDLQAAKEAFEKAKRLGCANTFTYAAFIDVSFAQGYLEEAKNLVEASGITPPIKYENEKKIFDLHDLSHGTGIVLLLKYYENCGAFPLTVITGKGIHGSKEPLAFKKSIIDYFSKQDKVKLIFNEDPNNAGRLVIRDK